MRAQRPGSPSDRLFLVAVFPQWVPMRQGDGGRGWLPGLLMGWLVLITACGTTTTQTPGCGPLVPCPDGQECDFDSGRCRAIDPGDIESPSDEDTPELAGDDVPDTATDDPELPPDDGEDPPGDDDTDNPSDNPSDNPIDVPDDTEPEGPPTGPVLALDPPRIDFGYVRLYGAPGGDPSQWTLIVRNPGIATLEVTELTILAQNGSNEFAVWVGERPSAGEGDDDAEMVGGSGLPLRVAPGGTGRIEVEYIPVDAGADSAILRIGSNDPGRPVAMVELTSRYGGPSALSVTPTSIAFGSVGIGETAEARRLTILAKDLEAGKNRVVTIQRIGLARSEAVFSILAPPAPILLGPGAEFVVDVNFAPGAPLAYNVDLIVESDAQTDGRLTIPLTGVGATQRAQVQPDPVSFGAVRMTVESRKLVTLSNVGTLPFRITQVELNPESSSAFSLDTQNVPGRFLPVSQSASVSIAFLPPRVDRYEGELIFRTDARDPRVAEIRVALSGEGIDSDFVVTPASVVFDPLRPGRLVEQRLTLQNRGAEDLLVESIAFDPPPGEVFGFRILNGWTPPYAIQGGRTELGTLTFAPTTRRAYGTTLIIRAQGLNPVRIDVAGRGIEPEIRVVRPDGEGLGEGIDFGEIIVNTRRSVQLEITNVGDALLERLALNFARSGGAFFIEGAVPPRLNPEDAAVRVQVVYRPTMRTGQDDTNVLRIDSDDPLQARIEIPLRGRAINPSLDARPNGLNASQPLDLGAVDVGQIAGPAEVTLRNVGDGELVIRDIAATADTSPIFTVIPPQRIPGGTPEQPLPWTLRAFTEFGDELKFHVRAAPTAAETTLGAVALFINDARADAQGRMLYYVKVRGKLCPPGWYDADDNPNTGTQGCEYRCDPSPTGIEVCNGFDDNCDGRIDEGFRVGVACDGLGACGVGFIQCHPTDSSRSICSTEPGGLHDQSRPERCDRLDNDCDGLVDESPEAETNSCPRTAHGDYRCENGGCVLTCRPGYHLCGESCEDNSLVATCGSRCDPCPGVTNGRAVCNEDGVGLYSCDITCNAGYVRLDRSCVLSSDPTVCGSPPINCLDPPPGYPRPPNDSTAACILGRCEYTCNTGYRFDAAANACVLNESLTCCGPSCRNCTLIAPAGSIPRCRPNSSGVLACDFDCPPGRHRCGNQCALDTDINTCGSSCDPCPLPTNGSPTCDGVRCGVICNTGYHACGTQCRPDDDATACGADCRVCPGDDHGIPACVCDTDTQGQPDCSTRQCALNCHLGWHFCSGGAFGTGRCVDNTSTATCGSRCAPCPTPTVGSVSCDGLACRYTCPTGYNACVNQGCFTPNDPDRCGASCAPCPDPGLGGVRVCDNGVCMPTCPANTRSCGGRCRSLTDATACGPHCIACTAPANATPACRADACAFDCAPGYRDANEDPTDGCEYACTPTSSDGTDEPDAQYIDADCDGIDGDKERAFFVVAGATNGDGSMAQPFGRIEEGIAAAQAHATRKQVLVGRGSYLVTATVVIPAGVRVYGGYDPADGWRRDSRRTYRSELSGTTPLIRMADTGTALTGIDGMILRAADAPNTPGSSSVGILLVNVGTETFVSYNDVTSGFGRAGRAGTDAPNIANAVGPTGANGGGAASGRVGSGGGPTSNTFCDTDHTRGGRGGNGGGNPCRGQDGSPAGLGGAGGDGSDGARGGNGSVGNGGANGNPANAAGRLDGETWIGGEGGAGTAGTHGRGGGGGGGGSCSTRSVCRANGGGGGAGGAGGCGGGGGTGGGGGGGSFAIVVLGGEPRIQGNLLTTSTGGAGGAGGRGAEGSAGSAGGGGGSGEYEGACGGVSGRVGGPGGYGGAGGRGGHGAGGAGGMSVAVLYKGTTSTPAPRLIDNQIRPGAGGLGGTSPGIGAGGPGGISADLYSLP